MMRILYQNYNKPGTNYPIKGLIFALLICICAHFCVPWLSMCAFLLVSCEGSVSAHFFVSLSRDIPAKSAGEKKNHEIPFLCGFFVKCLEMCFWFPFDYTLWAWCHLFLPARALINVIYETTSPDRAGRKGATQMFVQMSYCSIPNVCSKWPFQLQK